MPIRLISLLCLFFLSLLSSGCNGARETDQVAYVLLVGIDKDASGQIVVTYLMPVPQTMGGVEPGKAESATVVTSVAAPSLAEARNLINSSVARTLNLSHVAAFIFGEDYARQGLRDSLGPSMRFREFRGSMFLLVTRGTAREFIENNKPRMEFLPSRWVETILNNTNDTGYYKATTLHEFYSRLKSATGSPCASAVSIDAERISGIPTAEMVPGQRAERFTAGNDPHLQKTHASIFGLAVFRGDKLVGFFDNEETRMVNILENKFRSGFFTLDDPLLPSRPVHLVARLGQAPDIRVDTASTGAAIHIRVQLEAEITSIPSGINYEAPEYRTLLEAQLSRVVEEEMLQMLAKSQRWGADAANLGSYARRNFLTFADLEAYDWDSHYSSAVIAVNVETNIRRMGLMRKSNPIREVPQ